MVVLASLLALGVSKSSEERQEMSRSVTCVRKEEMSG